MPSPLEPSPDERLASLARARDGLFTYDDAIAAGLTRATISSRTRAGLWVGDAARVYRAASTPEDVATRERALLLRLGEDAMLSHLSAARRWGLIVPESQTVWATVPWRSRPAASEGTRVVRSRHTSNHARCYQERLAVTSPERTLADLAMVLRRPDLTAAFLQAVQRRLCRIEQVDSWYQRLAGRPGSRLLREVIKEFDPAFESILTIELDRLARRAGIALLPRCPVRLANGIVIHCDLGDPELRLDVEADGWGYHCTKRQLAADKARDRAMAAVGWLTVRYDTDSIRREPEATVADLQEQVAARKRFLDGSG